MLKVQLDSCDLEVFFHHGTRSSDQIKELEDVHVDGDRRCSVAVVKLGGVIAHEGLSICNPKDNFCKSIGRKKALAFAVDSFSPEDRTAIWRAYEVQFGF